MFQRDIQQIKSNIPVSWFHNLEVTQDKAKEPRGWGGGVRCGWLTLQKGVF